MPKNARISLEGMDRLLDLIHGSKQSIYPYMSKAVYEEASEAFGFSQELVPVRDGYLKGSGGVKPPIRSGGAVNVEIYYGGVAAPYAEFVHDRPARHEPPTRSKYLKIPVDNQVQGLGDRLLARMEHMFRNRGRF